MSSTVEIVAGTSERTSRIALKRAMSAFGEVDACHMGDRGAMGDRFTEFPIVRFKTQSAAEACLAAIKAGQLFLDGSQLQGEFKGGGGPAARRLKPPERRTAPIPAQSQAEEDMSSRMLLDGSNRDSHSTFGGRDQRRDARDGYSNRRVADASSRNAAGRSRSRRRRSPSKKRKHNSRSRSRSDQKRSGHSAVAALGGGCRLVKLKDMSIVGNLESEMSDNPLFVAAK